MTRRLVTILTFSVSIIILLLMAIWAVQYFHIRSFRTAVVDLVETGTGGTYSLEIGDTDIDYLNFALTIEDLVVKKKDSTDIRGIMQVRVPRMVIDLGSITRVLTSNQFKIDRLSITEPVATIGLKDQPESEDTAQSEPLNFPHQIARFYPVVKTILEHFDIALFQIERAALTLEKSQDAFQVRLLDLLVSDWNMQHLADKASFHLSLGNQSVKLQNAEFSFGAVVWDYHQKELDILDYKYIQRDSLQREVMNVTGASLKIVKFDYERLMLEEEYYLDRLLIIDPKVTAQIHSSGAKPEKGAHPLSDILKTHFGTMMIRDGEILNAQIEATIYQEHDTVFLHLPKFNLITGNFHVDEDSTTLMIDQLELDIHRTELDINHQLALSFKNLIYDQDYNVKIDSIRIFNKQSEETLLYSQEMDFYNFSLFHFFFENDLKMDSVFLREAEVNLVKQSLASNPRSRPQPQRPTPTLNVGRLHLQNVNATLEMDQGESIILLQNASVDDISFDGAFEYSIRMLQVPSFNLMNGKGVELSIQNLLMEPRQISLDELAGSYQGLDFAGNDFKIIANQAISHQSLPTNLSLLEIAQLSLSGSLPVKKERAKSASGFQAYLEKAAIGSLKADLNINDSSRVRTTLSDFKLSGAGFTDEKAWSYQYLQTNVTSGTYQKGPFTYKLDHARINTNSKSRFAGVEITKKDEFKLQTASVDLGPIHKGSDSLSIEHVILKKIEYSDIPGKSTSTIDSIRFNQAYLSGGLPFSHQVFIHGPDLNFVTHSSKEKSSSSKKDFPAPSKLFRDLIIYPGRVSLNEQELNFGKIKLEVEADLMLMDIRKLSFKTKTSSIHVGRIWSGSSDLYLDSIYLVPTPEYVQQVEEETDIMAVQVNRTRLHQVKWDILKEHGSMESDSLTIDGIDISIKRDKTLPDPEHQGKPYLLAEFIPDLENVNIPRIIGRNGKMVYQEIGEKTGEAGQIAIENISFEFNRSHPLSEPEKVSRGRGLIYGEAPISYEYHRLDSGRFSLQVDLTNMPLVSLNQMVDPLEAARFKSGHLHEFKLNLIGDSLQTAGTGTITYDDLHVEIFKSHQPDVKNFGSELLTLLVDKLILKHSKYQASAEFVQDRITFKGPINYWVKSGIHGASAAVIKGKSSKNGRRKADGLTP